MYSVTHEGLLELSDLTCESQHNMETKRNWEK